MGVFAFKLPCGRCQFVAMQPVEQFGGSMSVLQVARNALADRRKRAAAMIRIDETQDQLADADRGWRRTGCG
jgi:hypothetical protein